MKTTIWTATITGTMLLAGAARGEIVHATYTGTIGFGEDPKGRFGAPSRDISGKTLRLDFYFVDTNAGAVGRNDEIDGGTAYGTGRIAATTVSVDGVTHSFHTGYKDTIFSYKGLPNTYTGANDEISVSNTSARGSEGVTAAVISYIQDFLTSPNLGAAVDYTSVAPPLYYDRSSMRAYDPYGFFAAAIITIHLTIDAYAGTLPPDPVPEPAALALLGLGAAVLAATRRR